MNDMLETINKICAQLPPGWSVELCMANDDVHDGAWVRLIDLKGKYPPNLPDSAGKTIIEQLNDALCVAKGGKT